MNRYTEKGEGHGGRIVPESFVESNRLPAGSFFKSKNAKNLHSLYESGAFTNEPIIFNNEGKGPVKVDYEDFSGKDDLISD